MVAHQARSLVAGEDRSRQALGQRGHRRACVVADGAAAGPHQRALRAVEQREGAPEIARLRRRRGRRLVARRGGR
jgi:hypothetical protein